jgi:hypothetical protein
MPLKNGRSAGNSAYTRKGTIWRVMVTGRAKVSFEQMAAPVPEIMDGSLYFSCDYSVLYDSLTILIVKTFTDVSEERTISIFME